MAVLLLVPAAPPGTATSFTPVTAAGTPSAGTRSGAYVGTSSPSSPMDRESLMSGMISLTTNALDDARASLLSAGAGGTGFNRASGMKSLKSSGSSSTAAAR